MFARCSDELSHQSKAIWAVARPPPYTFSPTRPVYPAARARSSGMEPSASRCASTQGLVERYLLWLRAAAVNCGFRLSDPRPFAPRKSLICPSNQVISSPCARRGTGASRSSARRRRRNRGGNRDRLMALSVILSSCSARPTCETPVSPAVEREVHRISALPLNFSEAGGGSFLQMQCTCSI